MLPPLLLWITISHQFVCLPTLELITFEQQVYSTKIGYTNALSLGRNSRKKKECDHFEQRTSSKKSSATLTVVCLNYLNLRDLFGVWIKLKESIFKNNHQINSTVTTRIWVLFDRMDVSKYKIVIRMKKWSWFPFAYIVDVFLQNALVLYHINKDEGDESLPLLAWNFS